MKPLVDRVHSTWAKVAVLLVGAVAVMAWMWVFPNHAQGAVVQSGECHYSRASQYGPVSSSCDPGSAEIGRTSVGVECGGAAGIGALFGGPKAGAGAGLGCLWAKLF